MVTLMLSEMKLKVTILMLIIWEIPLIKTLIM